MKKLITAIIANPARLPGDNSDKRDRSLPTNTINAITTQTIAMRGTILV